MEACRLNILFIGDIFGRPGRQACREHIADLRQEHDLDLVIANAENAAGGLGLTPPLADELFGYGIDVMTLGNHTWDKKEIYDYLDIEHRVLRPANYPGDPPGVGYTVVHLEDQPAVAVISLHGRVFFPVDLDCPFRAATSVLKKLSGEAAIIVVDIHAEASSEKVAMGWYLAGRVSAVLGTHTHIATADTQLLKNHTGYVTDVGMTGPSQGVLGVDRDIVIERFLTQMPNRFEVAPGAAQFNSVLLEVDNSTGRCLAIKRIDRGIPASKTQSR